MSLTIGTCFFLILIGCRAHNERLALISVIGRLVVTVALIGIGGKLALSSDNGAQKAGIGLLGVVAGYWLK